MLNTYIIVFLNAVILLIIIMGWRRYKKFNRQIADLEVKAVKAAEEKRLRDITDNIGHGVYVLDQQGIVTFMNPEAEKLLGFKEHELVGKYMHDFVHYKKVNGTPVSREECPVLRITGSGATYRRDDDYYLRKDGTCLPVSYVATPILKAGGATGIVIAFQDMTSALQAKQKIIDAEKSLRLLIDNAPMGIVVCDRKGNIKNANPVALNIFGSPSLQETSKINLLTYPPMVKVGISDTFRRCIEKGETTVSEHFYLSNWGKNIHIRLHITPIKSERDEIVGAQALLEDFTLRKQSERALMEREESYRQLIENAPLGVLVINKQGNIITANPSIVKELGFTSVESLCQINALTFSPLVEAGIAENIEKCLEQGETIFSEHQYITEAGTKLWLRFYISSIKDSLGLVQSVQALVEDITQRKQVEKELRKKERRIEKELQLANIIQSSLFPVNLPQVPGIVLAATAVSAMEVGGDYCDLFLTKGHKLGIAIGDVMGKGVPAALFVAMTYAFVRNYALEANHPSQVVNRTNRSLYPQLEFTEQFLTLFYSIYDPETRELRYTNAGHNPPIVYRAATGKCETLEVRDYIVGGRQNSDYREGTIILESGDVVLFYTDGLKEGKNKEREQFGTERIYRLLKENSIYDPASIQEIISMEFNDFLAGEPPYDDVTMIVIKVN